MAGHVGDGFAGFFAGSLGSDGTNKAICRE